MSQVRKQRLNELIQPVVQGMGCEYVGCELISQHGQTVLRVYIDTPEGVKIEECTAISRQLGAVLDVEDVLTQRYRLEVSSPGLERPLFTLEHFKQFLGRRVRVKSGTPIEGQSRFTGILVTVDDDGNVVLSTEFGEKKVPFLAIIKANLVWEK